jgi:hypothetical protein
MKSLINTVGMYVTLGLGMDSATEYTPRGACNVQYGYKPVPLI